MTTESRIQQAMMRLLLRQGFDKTTTQDIANEANVARSTIYTKWKTKEEIVEHLLWQQAVAYLDAWYLLVQRDPKGGSFAGIYKNALLAVQQNPFINALYSQNNFVLGNFVNHERFTTLLSERLTWNKRLLSMMQDAGLIRGEVDVETSAWVALVFRQGMLTTPINDIGQGQANYEGILDLFVTMLHQFAAVSIDHSNEVGKEMLKRYIDELKAQLSPNISG
ncbi:MAG: TetR/AcrR family transcriptional regulator [Chloroflexota bacterium]